MKGKTVGTPVTWVFILFLVTVTGCSSTNDLTIRLAYSRLDNSIAKDFLEYADFDQQQERWIRNAAREFQIWHRKSELPVYAETLKRVASVVESGDRVESSAVLNLFSELEEFSNRSYVKLPFANSVEFLSGLSDEQVDQIAFNFIERNRKQLERIQEQESKPDNSERIDRFETSLGRIGLDLTSEQRNIIDEGLNQYVGSREDRIAVWGNWQQEFIELLQMRDQEAFEVAMAKQIGEYRGQMEIAYPERSAKNTEVAAGTIANLVNSLDDDQRSELVSRMRQTSVVLLAMSETRQSTVI